MVAFPTLVPCIVQDLAYSKLRRPAHHLGVSNLWTVRPRPASLSRGAGHRFGSSWYGRYPSNQTLFWDRLPTPGAVLPLLTIPATLLLFPSTRAVGRTLVWWGRRFRGTCENRTAPANYDTPRRTFALWGGQSWPQP